MNKLSIIVFTDSFYPVLGGRERVIDALMREFNKVSECVLVTQSFNSKNPLLLPFKTILSPSIKVFNDGFLSIKTRSFKHAVESYIKEKKPSVIHIETKFSLAKYGIKLSKIHNIPLVATAHTDYINQYKKQLKFPFIYKLLLRNVTRVLNQADIVTTVSMYMKNELISLGVKEDKIVIIPNGNDMVNIDSSTINLDELRAKHKLKENVYTFIYSGRLVETKNLGLLFNALKLIKEKGVDFEFVLAGEGSKKKYISLAKKLGIESNCKFLGRIEDRRELAGLYSLSSLNLVPSKIESFGLTVREAGAMGTPSVVMRGSATSENIVSGKNGFISNNTCESFAETIINALKSNLREIGENAKNTFNQDWQTVAKLYLDVYKKLREE